MSDLYDADVFRWTEQQAALLRRRAFGEVPQSGSSAQAASVTPR